MRYGDVLGPPLVVPKMWDVRIQTDILDVYNKPLADGKMAEWAKLSVRLLFALTSL